MSNETMTDGGGVDVLAEVTQQSESKRAAHFARYKDILEAQRTGTATKKDADDLKKLMLADALDLTAEKVRSDARAWADYFDNVEKHNRYIEKIDADKKRADDAVEPYTQKARAFLLKLIPELNHYLLKALGNNCWRAMNEEQQKEWQAITDEGEASITFNPYAEQNIVNGCAHIVEQILAENPELLGGK